MTNIVKFPSHEPDFVDPKVVLDAAKKRVSECVVIGWTEDGTMYVSGSHADHMETIALLEVAKAAFIKECLS